MLGFWWRLGFITGRGVSHNPTKIPPCNACRLSASGLPYLRETSNPKSTVRTQQTVLKTQDSESPPAVLKACTTEYCYTVTLLQDFYSRIEVFLELGS